MQQNKKESKNKVGTALLVKVKNKVKIDDKDILGYIPYMENKSGEYIFVKPSSSIYDSQNEMVYIPVMSFYKAKKYCKKYKKFKSKKNDIFDKKIDNFVKEQEETVITEKTHTTDTNNNANEIVNKNNNEQKNGNNLILPAENSSVTQINVRKIFNYDSVFENILSKYNFSTNSVIFDSNTRLKYLDTIINDNAPISPFLKHIYPNDYFDTIQYLLNKIKSTNSCKRDTNEVEMLHSIVKLPIITNLNFNEQEIKNKIDNILGNNNTLKEVCEIVIGYYIDLKYMFKESDYFITLKSLSKLKNISPLSLLLIGEPGTGKTWIGEIISDILNLPYLRIECASYDHLGLLGSSPQWSGSKEGIITRTLIEKQKFPVIVNFDEVDKTGHSNEHRFIDTINHVIDPMAVVSDTFLGLPLYFLKTSTFLLTANTIDGIPDYILSRVYRIHVKPLDKHLLVDYVINKIINDFSQKGSYQFLLKHLNSERIKNNVLNLIDNDKMDFRSLLNYIKLILYKYNSPWNNQKDFVEFFEENIRCKEKQNKTKQIGFITK